uniref:Uncharacterized protein n=1 Tax=Anguilla anguilla TaxID=7936 RepID=A0A0E9RK99_ANGAN
MSGTPSGTSGSYNTPYTLHCQLQSILHVLRMLDADF